MTDLERRLRTWVGNPLCIEAADEIERLRELLKGPDPHYDMAREIGILRAEMDERMKAYIEYQERDEAEIERLRTALQYYSTDGASSGEIARRALERK